ncbi:ribose transport system substrate-binding protein [Kitasatospora sp. MAP12-15]|uniref:substrate-binding domain-containing protein n=1 Tax=unclassified Kitasatospora TaxID=2633591 RepID=UPI0024760BF8|nr:substrate-binding domain-containing protein [Kitasatospora sp. MAP12-44]MDH6115395.1 ribose transport system substrate-binding protein [Kitasatospora sp. MAP12-44]
MRTAIPPRRTAPRRGSGLIRLTVLLAATSVVLSAAACSKQGAGAASPTTSGATAVSIQGDITFNDANLAELDQSIKDALAGQDLSQLNEAMVVNVAVDYWNAGKIGFNKGTSDLSIKGTFQAPANGRLDQQLSMLSALHSQNLTGLEVSAIDATAVKAPIDSYTSAGVPVLAIDSPLPPEDGAALYLGTPNYQAGQKAGEAMKAALGGKGQVVVLVGSLTASNAVERIQGFEDALKGSDVKVLQKISDGMDQSKALSNAENAFQTDPGVNGIYGVYSYDGPAAGQAVQSSGKSGTIKVVCDDSDPQTLDFIKKGVIQASILQQPYQQGYTGAYLLAALKVLGKDATMALVKPYLESDGTTLSSGVGVLTQANLADYQSMLAKLGING